MRYLLLILLFFAAGCGRMAPFRYQVLEPDCTDLRTNVDKAFCSSSFHPGDFSNAEWWHLFQNPELDSLVVMGLENHPSIKAAEARIYLASEQSALARAALFPTVALDGDITKQKASDFSADIPALGWFTEVFIKFVNFFYTIDIWKKYHALFYGSLDEVQAQWAEEKEAEILLSSAIAQTYFHLQMDLSRRQIAQRVLQERQTFFEMLNKRFQQAVDAITPLYEMDIRIQEARDTLAQIEQAIEFDLHALQALVGNAACTSLCLSPSIGFPCSFPLPCSLPLDLIARRPEIIAQLWHIDALGFEIYAAQASFYPNFNLLAFFSLDSFKLSRLFTYDAMYLFADIAPHLPLFDPRLQANLGIAKENLEIAVQEYNQMILDAVQEVSDALTALRTADERLALEARSLSDARSYYELIKLRFENGVDNIMDVLAAEEEFLFYQDQNVQREFDRYQGVVALIQALGGGYNCAFE